MREKGKKSEQNNVDQGGEREKSHELSVNREEKNRRGKQGHDHEKRRGKKMEAETANVYGETKKNPLGRDGERGAKTQNKKGLDTKLTRREPGRGEHGRGKSTGNPKYTNGDNKPFAKHLLRPPQITKRGRGEVLKGTNSFLDHVDEKRHISLHGPHKLPGQRVAV